MGACRRTLQEGFAPAALTPVRPAEIYVPPPPQCQHQCYNPTMLSHLSDFMKCRRKFWSMFPSFLYVNATMARTQKGGLSVSPGLVCRLTLICMHKDAD